MIILIGLGNPGEQYEFTRHNTGKLFIKYLARERKLKFKKLGKFFMARESNNFSLVFLDSYMNLSGEGIRDFLDVTGYDLDDVIVVCDDINLRLGEMRLREKGSSGGHRGLENIIEVMETQDFKRWRIGIGPLPRNISAREFVLSPFQREEIEILGETFERGKLGFEILLEEGFKKAQEFLNRRGKNV